MMAILRVLGKAMTVTLLICALAASILGAVITSIMITHLLWPDGPDAIFLIVFLLEASFCIGLAAAIADEYGQPNRKKRRTK